MRKIPQLWLPAMGVSLISMAFSAAGIVFGEGIETPPVPLPTLDSVIDNSATIQAPAPAAEMALPAADLPATDAAAPIPVESAAPVPQPITLQEPTQMLNALPATPTPAVQPAPIQQDIQAPQIPVQQAPVQQYPVQQAPVQQYPVQQIPVQPQPQPAPVQQGTTYTQYQPASVGFGWFLPPLRVYRAGEFNGSAAPAYAAPAYGAPAYGAGQGRMGLAPRRGASIDQGPYYTTRGPRDFYLQNPRPLGP